MKTVTGAALGAARSAWGAYLLAEPEHAIRVLGGRPDHRAVVVARILGGRHLAQGLLEVAFWPGGRRLGASVDFAHAATGVALALLDPARRRPALTDAATATTFGIVGLTAPT